jgi:hypothetical protein
VVAIALVLLGRLKSRRLEEYDALRKYARKAVAGGDVLFLPALNFLFLLGLVEYRPKTDSLEYAGPNEAV